MNNRVKSSVRGQRGAAAIYTLVILVPVLFALIGFAVDLGILYSVKGELKAAASSMALASAQQLIGTGTATAAGNTAAQLTIENGSGFGNRYYFHGLAIGQTSGAMVSTVSDPAYYATVADALASATSAGSEVGGPQARHVRVTITGQTQLLFWSFLPIVSDRTVTVLASSVAGMSAPLCEACGIEPFSVAAPNQNDATDFGFVPGMKYSLYFLCTGGSPPILPGAAQSVAYALLNRYDSTAAVFADASTQAFRDGAGGLPGSTNSGVSCFRINNPEVIWPNLTINRCGAAQLVAPIVTDAMCGLDTRFESSVPGTCAGIPSADSLISSYQPDTDPNNYDTYEDYTGTGRRIITVPVVDTLSSTASMNVLGFRQFLLIPAQGGTNLNAADAFGRFVAMYIGSVAPLRQGRFDSCQINSGPGKVVLHQ